ncbi:unnamed protein product [Ambrosiozyma monospora]|uniref:Unnamed protein product n=1 Tax=Ambrosiozyma monospora TaxID=43982 RepID=A0ACB5T7V7_AMBMO|nr:unnamed protein product [Ambrosiozyma monospora]
MVKRTKQQVEEEDSDIDVSSTDDEELVEEEEEMINVDFDFFDLNPTIDFQATKNFLRQLFGDDNVFFTLSDLADLILRENHVGTTIKTDGMESDPFSLLSVINVTDNLDNPALKALTKYILEKTSSKTDFNLLLRQLLLKSSKSKFRTGLIISERLLNMPVETAPPMYRMLLEEMEKADDKDKEYKFDYFLIPSRVYKLVASTIDEEMDDEGLTRSKKAKKGTNLPEELDYYHYEDEVLEKHSLYHGYFDFTNEKVESDGRRVFTEYGIDPKFSLILIDKKSLLKASEEMAEKFAP